MRYCKLLQHKHGLIEKGNVHLKASNVVMFVPSLSQLQRNYSDQVFTLPLSFLCTNVPKMSGEEPVGSLEMMGAGLMIPVSGVMVDVKDKRPANQATAARLHSRVNIAIFPDF